MWIYNYMDNIMCIIIWIILCGYIIMWIYNYVDIIMWI